MQLDLGFHLHLDVLGLVVALGVGYVYGRRLLTPRHAPRGEPAVTRRQQVAFFSGLGLLALVTSWPFHDIGEESLFMFHMTEHMVLALAVPPLLLIGTPWWLLRLVVAPIMPLVRFATRPLVALLTFNAVLAALHAPAVVEAMVTSSLFHLGAHTLLLLTAIQMWWPVIGPIPDTPRLAPFPRMGYLFLQSLVPTVPASFLTLSETPVYKIYGTFPRLWDIPALTDQTVAGLIMKLGGGAVLWTAIAITYFRWVAEEEGATVVGAGVR
jgi:putative membrane protein